MIKNTFCILDGIGERIERRLWKNRILTWEDFLLSSEIPLISKEQKQYYDNFLRNACYELEKNNAEYFAETIKRKEHWRLYDIFKDKAVCLDIETNGYMPGSGGYITIIGMYDGNSYKSFIRGVNLTISEIDNELRNYKYLITFYGAVFDIPFIQKTMHGVNFNILHFDICFGARKTGFKGGLKRLEKEFGLQRNEFVKDMDGYDAVRLWEYAKQGSKEAFELLLLYNKEDTVNLFKLAEKIYYELRSQTGIEEYL